ncbi:MAG: hypothetical protein KAI66_12730 [Lentisphaeria bacterium]|nr:hypothetical protein [Lentisphaeria bacterium]
MSEENNTNIHLITGTDETTAAAEADRIVREVAGDEPDAFGLDIIHEHDGASVADLINQVVQSILSPPFLGGRKTVWLQNFSQFGAEGTKKSKSADAKAFQELTARISDGIPPDIMLVMNGSGLDRTKSLARACKKRDALRVFDKPDLKKRGWQQSMMDVVAARATAKGVQLSPAVCNHLVEVLGTDTARIDNELEKLICYCGAPENPITLEAAEEVCVGSGEELSWALDDAVGSRNLAEALRIVDVLMRQGKNPDSVARSLIGQTGRLLRHLIHIKLFMAQRRVPPHQVYNTVQNLSSEEKTAFASQGLTLIATGHPFVAGKVAKQSGSFTGDNLIDGLRAVRDAYVRTVSSALNPRIALEELLMRVLGPTK